ncbi:MAG TPA: PAS domain S-box protein [Chitinispirillaceae bacterium]|nr:PAS domain S-box protein [Chitinispirillaceae bacterium]
MSEKDHELSSLQNALREQENLYRNLIENSLDGITIVRNDRMLFANNTFCKKLGYTADELYALPSSSIIVHPDDRARAIKISRRRQFDHSIMYDDFRMVTKSGEAIDFETSSRIIDYKGEKASFFTARDVTEKRRMQEALANSERNYRELVEKTSLIILRWDVHGNLTFLNEYGQRFFGYSGMDIIGKSVPGFVFGTSEDGTDRKNAACVNAILADPQRYVHCINECYCMCGKRVWISWSNSPLKDATGAITGISSIGTDITKRIMIEKELQSAKDRLELLNKELETRVEESSRKLAETYTQLITLQKENIQSQFEVLRQQVNPHFLFNSLNVLTSLIKLEPDLAERFSEQLSKVYRYVLENKDDELVDLHTELRFLDAYIFLLNIRFVDKIRVNIDIPEPARKYRLIPLAMQLLIENAIKHNIMTKTEPLIINIFIDNGNYLNIINNLQERPSQIVSTGVGLRNIKNRYQLLNNSLPLFEKTGTQFIAKIPLIAPAE